MNSDVEQFIGKLQEGLSAPLSGMGIAFSSSLFGLAGSLILGFLDLQGSGAQNRFYVELEDWLSTVTDISTDGAWQGEESGDIAQLLARLVRLNEISLRNQNQGQNIAGQSSEAVMHNGLTKLAERLDEMTKSLHHENHLLRSELGRHAAIHQEILALMHDEKLRGK